MCVKSERTTDKLLESATDDVPKMIVIYCHFRHCEIVWYGLFAIVIIIFVLSCSLAAYQKIKTKRQSQRFNKQIREQNNDMLTFRHQEKTDGS